VAIVDQEFTLKELGTENGSFILKPRNKDYPIIRPTDGLEIFGVMVGLVRRFRD
jgi:repressor LexA